MTTATAPPPVRPGGYRAALQEREFAGILAAFAASVLGDSVAYLAVTVLVFERTHSPLLSSLVFAVAFAPYLVGGTLLAALVDRLRPRALLVGFDLAAGALVCLMLVPHAPVPLLFGVLLAVGTLAPIRAGASAALVAEVLPEEAFVAGRSALQVTAQLGQVVGIAAGGALVALVGPRLTLVGDAVSFAVSAAVIARTVHDRAARTDERGSVVAGSLRRIGAVWAERPVRRLLVVGWLLAFVSVSPEGLAAPAVTQAGAGTGAIGLWLGALPVGVIAGDLLAVRFVPVGRRPRVVLPLGATLCVVLAIFALDPPLWLAVPLLVASGMTSAYGLGLNQRLRTQTPPALLSQALTTSSTGLMVVQGVGFAVAGGLGEVLPAHVAIAVTGAAGLASLGLLRGGLAR